MNSNNMQARGMQKLPSASSSSKSDVSSSSSPAADIAEAAFTLSASSSSAGDFDNNNYNTNTNNNRGHKGPSAGARNGTTVKSTAAAAGGGGNNNNNNNKGAAATTAAATKSTISNDDPRLRFELITKIGKGGYGYVCKAWDRVEERLVAVKIINLEDAGDEVDDVHQEINVMSNIHCAQLTKYHSSFVVGANLWIIMEYLEAGALLDIIKECGPLEEEFVAFIMKELLEALQYLHRERKIHRDVKAGNLLVGGDGAVKLADFGVTGQLTDSMNKRQTKIGTPFWMAPEVITQSSYDGCADIWSTGITAIELCKGEPPYASKIHPFQAILLIPKNPAPVLEGDTFSAEFRDFVSRCLVKDPAQRSDAAQLLQHPFVANARKSQRWCDYIRNLINERNRKMISQSMDEAVGGESGLTLHRDSDNDTWNFTQRTHSQQAAGHSQQNSVSMQYRNSSSGSNNNNNSSNNNNNVAAISALGGNDSRNSSGSNLISRSSSSTGTNYSTGGTYLGKRDHGIGMGTNTRDHGIGASGGPEGDSPITIASVEYESSGDEEMRSATPPKHRPAPGVRNSQQQQQQQQQLLQEQEKLSPEAFPTSFPPPRSAVRKERPPSLKVPADASHHSASSKPTAAVAVAQQEKINFHENISGDVTPPLSPMRSGRGSVNSVFFPPTMSRLEKAAATTATATAAEDSHNSSMSEISSVVANASHSPVAAAAAAVGIINNSSNNNSGSSSRAALKQAMETIQEMQRGEDELTATIAALRAENSQLRQAAAPYFEAVKIMLQRNNSDSNNSSNNRSNNNSNNSNSNTTTVKMSPLHALLKVESTAAAIAANAMLPTNGKELQLQMSNTTASATTATHSSNSNSSGVDNSELAEQLSALADCALEHNSISSDCSEVYSQVLRPTLRYLDLEMHRTAAARERELLKVIRVGLVALDAISDARPLDQSNNNNNNSSNNSNSRSKRTAAVATAASSAARDWSLELCSVLTAYTAEELGDKIQ